MTTRPVSVETYQHFFEAAQPNSENSGWTILLLHGTGGSERDLVPLGRTLLPGAAILSPRGQVNEGGALRFFRRHAEGLLDQEDLEARSTEMAAWIKAASSRYAFDPNRLIAVGFSNGANLAASMLLRGMAVPLMAVLLSPMLPFEPETTPDLTGRSVFIGAGQADPLVPVAQTKQLEQVLRQAGAAVRIFWVPSGHGITPEEVRQAQTWLQETVTSAAQ